MLQPMKTEIAWRCCSLTCPECDVTRAGVLPPTKHHASLTCQNSLHHIVGNRGENIIGQCCFSLCHSYHISSGHIQVSARTCSSHFGRATLCLHFRKSPSAMRVQQLEVLLAHKPWHEGPAGLQTAVSVCEAMQMKGGGLRCRLLASTTLETW